SFWLKREGGSGDFAFLGSDFAHMQITKFSRAFDAVIFTLFLLFLAGFSLFGLGELHKMGVANLESSGKKKKKAFSFAMLVNKMLPFPDNKFEFNLTHVLLFGMLIAVLSLNHHRAQDEVEQKHEKQKKKADEAEQRQKREAEAARREKEEASKENASNTAEAATEKPKQKGAK
ncbi:unnamed protein product, partial [Prorocentrum cordatum]